MKFLALCSSAATHLTLKLFSILFPIKLEQAIANQILLPNAANAGFLKTDIN